VFIQISPKRALSPNILSAMKKILLYSAGLALLPSVIWAQPFDISTFDTAALGPWSELARTTLMVPKVPNGSVNLDGAASAQEYGGFQAVTVTPGSPDGTVGNAWILDFPGDRAWDGPDDSSFTYWLAHDDNHFYVGVHAKDDVVTSDDPNASFWKDDSIEIVVDALSDRFDNNTDNSKDPVGGHSYVNFEGRFSAWDETANAKAGESWASAVDWTYGATGDVFGSGKAVAGGWQMEVRFKKRLFEDATAGNKLSNGYRMGFNIGLDDDDKKGKGPSGDMSRSEDLEIQYFWANRQRYQGYTAEYLAGLSAEDRAAQVWRTDPEHPLIIDGNGRLSHGGTGEIIFGYDENRKSTGKILFVVSSATSPINADAGMIALLRAKGYTVTPFTSGGAPDDLRAAAVGQDVVLISESIGSATVLEPIGDPVVQKFILRDTDIPVISYESFMWDNAEWVLHPDDFSNEFSFFGNTGRTEDTQPVEIKDQRDSLHIRNAAHPIAGGLTGKVKVYNVGYSLNYGRVPADADVVASVEADGSFPTIFVYEKGDKLVDGTTVPNKRIGLYLGQVAALAANWNPELGFLTEEGKALLFNTLNYSIGATTAAPVLSVGRDGQNVVITYSGGVLQSTGALAGGTWSNEAGASPLRFAPTGAPKFYRVRAN
jgi:hypothetical protein